MNQEFTVLKALNNNVVICQAEEGREAIFIGRGIGFGKKRGDLFNETSYDKAYALVTESEREQYDRLFDREPEDTMLVIHEAIGMIQKAIGKRLHDRTLFALTQHIILALQRTRDDTEIQNPFLTETKWLYHDTYRIAEEVVRYIEAETGVLLPEAEIGFITLHIQSAFGYVERSAPDIITRCVHYAEEKSATNFDRESPAFRRLIQHLRQLIDLPPQHPEQKVDREMYLLLKKSHPVCYDISRNVIRMMEKASGMEASKRDLVQTVLTFMSAIESGEKVLRVTDPIRHE
ncbi:PRD domain-containing protein [Bacillus daqingensis]|uniref:PRD domain-containing protein n=1 Tax=Bacillus daqingensis TaxID=872396 RepID=A0ABV9NX76_9BACI